LALLAALWPLSTAFAIDEANTFNIVTVTAYGSVIETGDVLVVIVYDIDYTVQPIENAGQAFMAHYYDGSATPPQRLATAPYVFVNSGYGRGVMSIYRAAELWTPFAWADADSVQLTGNPAYFTLPQSLITAITWSAETEAAATLRLDIRDIAADLEIRTEWDGKSLINESVLTDDGEKYFLGAIPNLRTMAPGLFVASLGNPDFSERSHGTSYADSLDTFWTGSALENNWDNWADWFNVPSTMLKTMVVLALAIGVGAWVMSVTGEGLAIMPVSGIIIVAGTLINWVPLEFTAMMGFLGLLVIAFALFLKKATA